MANIRERLNKDGTATWRVEWRQDGTRQGQSFAVEVEAKSFKIHVEAAGDRWPRGWVKGQGFVEDTPGIAVPLLEEFGLHEIRLRTKADFGTKATYAGVLSRFCVQMQALNADAGRELVPTVQSITEEHMKEWIVSRLADGAAPKTIRNYHGIVSTVFAAAVKKGLRSDNPCEGHGLPESRRSHLSQRMNFLEEEQFALLADCMLPDAMYYEGETGVDPGGYRARATAGVCAGTLYDRWLIEAAVLTGLRWGEISALQCKDVFLRGSVHTRHRPYLQVVRAWKKNPPESSEFHRPGLGKHYLGVTKTVRADRTISLPPTAVAIFAAAMKDKQPDDFVFSAPLDGPLTQSAWWRRWRDVVALAVERGLTVRPRFHDLRHTHVSWLIAANVPLPDISRRLGHESISTTIDIYGGLLMTNDEVMHEALDRGVRGRQIVNLSAHTSDSRKALALPPVEIDVIDAELPDGDEDEDDL